MTKSLSNRLYVSEEEVAHVLYESRELKKRTEGIKEETGDGLYVRGRSDHSGKAHSGRSLRFKSRSGTGKLKCFICHSEDHLKRDCPIKKSSRFAKKGKRDKDSDSFDDEGDNRTCTIKWTRKVKIQLHDESSFILEDVRIRKKNCVYTLEAKVMIFDVQKHGGSKQVGLKQLDSKQVGFKQLGHKQLGIKQLGPGVETRVYGVQVSNDAAAVVQRRLKDKQLEENTNTNCLVMEQEKVHLGIKVGANVTVTEVPGQEGA
ncbi:zinc finger, CCHC-type containing protein [Tanacetum coccineum]